LSHILKSVQSSYHCRDTMMPYLKEDLMQVSSWMAYATLTLFLDSTCNVACQPKYIRHQPMKNTICKPPAALSRNFSTKHASDFPTATKRNQSNTNSVFASSYSICLVVAVYSGDTRTATLENPISTRSTKTHLTYGTMTLQATMKGSPNSTTRIIPTAVPMEAIALFTVPMETIALFTVPM
jgi:hypothetical protein